MKKILLPILFMTGYQLSCQIYTAGTPYANYNDIVPDSLLNYTVAPYTHETYSLDIFSGNGLDIELVAHGAVSPGGVGAYMMVTSLDPNVYIRFGRLDSVYVPANSNYNVTKVAMPLNQGDAINPPGAIWDNTSLYLTDHSGSGGGNKNVNDFVGGDKYIGLKYIDPDYNTPYYGWIWVRCTSEDSCYVKAYSRTANTVGIIENTASEFGIFPNPANDRVYLKGYTANNIDRESIRLMDVCGKEIPCKAEAGVTDISIDISTLPEGVYFISYLMQEKYITKKMIRQN